MKSRPQLIDVKETLASVLKEDRLSVREQLGVKTCSNPVDEARTTEDTMVVISQLDIALNNRHQARAALDRIRQERYGLCAACGQEISDTRLKALPVATRCIRCQELVELFNLHKSEHDTRLVRDRLDATLDAA
tara:strand:+ start:426 stop:827 length:402 start_codon:yes stop_codon:yes gene_type:complete